MQNLQKKKQIHLKYLQMRQFFQFTNFRRDDILQLIPSQVSRITPQKKQEK